MAEKIRVELDDATGPGFDSIASGAGKADQAVDGMASTMRSASNSTERLADDLEDAQSELADAQGEISDLENQIDELTTSTNKAANAIDKLGDEAAQTGKQVDKAGDSTKNVFNSDSLGRLAKGVLAFSAMKQGVELFGRGIKSLSDDGSPAFKKLSESIESTYAAALDLGNDPAVQEWVKSTSDSINNQLIPALKSIPATIRTFRDEASSFFSYWGEQIGIFGEGTLETNEEVRQSNEKLLKQKEEAIKKEQEQVNVTDKITEQAKKIAAEQEAANIKNLTDKTTLNTLLEEEIESLKELEKTGDRDRTKREAGLKRIELIQRTLAELPGKISEAEIKAQEESSQRRGEAEKQYQETVKAATEEANRVRDIAVQKVTAVADAKIDELRKAIADAKGIKGGNAIEEAKGNISKDDVLKKIQKTRADAAEQEIRDKQKAEGKIDQNGKAIAGGFDDQKSAQRKLDREIELARRKAQAGAFVDAKKNKIDGTEIDKAQTDILSGNIEQAQASGKLGVTTGKMAKEVLKAQQENLNAQAAMQQEIDGMRKALAGITATQQANNAKFRGQGRN